ncbi:tetratricopeptide repeat protein [Waterburya agarophytonicola K14]|uniref:Tetratricopeptide repeat protein n=1 Tax=Waterburya agarophytonicola KI4 TaxID=2874699 RepID=A0A964BPJ9_9CYAN|nr:tetratricopeptide repeat protein [Waterburya agarophytonicola KI4]
MNQRNFWGSIKVITLLVCASGVAWFGIGLVGKQQQVEQFERANDLLVQQKYSSAITAYDRLLATNIVKHHLIWINRGYAFLGLNRYQEMLQSCSTATLIEPEAATGWNCQGEALYYLKQYPDALQAFDKASSKNPQEATFWLNKARVLSSLEQYEQAIAASDRAIELSTQSTVDNLDRAIAFNQKGQNLLKIEQYQASLTAFEQSLVNSPNYLSAQQGKGIALYELGNYQQAIAVFEEILERDNLTKEQKGMSLLYIGVSLCQTQKTTAGEKVFQQVLQLTTDPQSQEIAQKGCGIK